MKKLYLLFLLPFILLACQQEKQNIIKGRIEGLKTGDRIILAVEDPDGSLYIPVDSTTVTKDGDFTLKSKVTDTYVRLFLLKSGDEFKPESTPSSMLFLEGYAPLDIKGNVDEWYYIKVQGGINSHPDMLAINKIIDSGQVLQKEGRKLLNEAKEKADNEIRKKATNLLMESNKILRSRDTLERAFVKNNPDVAYSAALLRYDYDTMEDFDNYEKVFNSLSPRVQASPAGILVKNYISNVHASEVGAVAPDFSLAALNGEEITLNKYKGRYVLLDFWGSWCGPCRQSSPMLVELYKQLKGNNTDIEFIGIACSENNEDNWKAAIENDNLSWIHLNDVHSAKGKSIQKLYAVMGVPSCVLISPDGKILYKDHPFEIIPKIKELFKLEG